ncbi:NADH-quinone oxidoreductase subunit N [Thalassotalea sp. 1_MG-2023]|uniref:NADH-quinone oxidoreductase subunit N n=1 Tax=Thalassotalea sp. 1_MG-2023 TaxID=3062680 RepID=UPI0026E455C0|nr:NADH-quinone oxidoreductase subunit N [Thalassotalea sp. 1_MG-2023]MDO6426594.1 NADH-quinone oxidoreductase subunit N [Thalassotalea sp. 1_MG-2023]
MSLNTWLLLTPQLLVALGVVCCLLLISWQRSQQIIAWFTLMVLLVTIVATVSLVGQPAVHVTELLYVDSFSLVAFLWVLLAGFAAVYMSKAYLHSHLEVHDEFYLLLLLTVLGAGVLVASDHFASLFLGFELLSISLVGLTGYFRHQRHAIEVSFKYLILSASASSFMLLGIAFLYSQTGSLSFVQMQAESADNMIAQIGFLLFIAGIGFKLSLVPFHFWTPDVYQGSPTPVTFVLATISKSAMFIALAKCFYVEGFQTLIALPSIHHALSALAIISMIVGNCLALGQNNIKRILAFSSIAHMGYLMIVLLVHQQQAILLARQAVLFYLFAYLIANIAIFGVLVLIERERNVGNNIELSHWKGMFWYSPIKALVLIVALLSLIGIPLTAGFIGKFYLIILAANNALWPLLIALIVGSGIALGYYLPMIFQLFKKEVVTMSHMTTWRIRLWISVIFLLSIGVGILPDMIITPLLNF